MATAALPRKPKLRRSVKLFERVSTAGKSRLRVDRKAKLIRGVKILGFHSRNHGSVLGKDFADMAGYDYDPRAIKEALPLYEGAPVNLDHLENERDRNGMRVPNQSRKVGQRFGKLQNVNVQADGAYADIRYLDNHPLTPMVLEAAEEMPDVFTMSHHAHGDVEKGDDGRGKVTKINQVHSVDMIAERPGTTTSLFESQGQTVKTKTTGTTGDAFGNVIRTVAMNTKLSKAARLKKIGRLIDVSDQFAKNFSDDSAVQEDDDTDVEEDMPTRGEDGPLAESYRGSPARRSLLEHLGRAPASRSDSLLNFLGRGPQRDAAANSLLASLGRR
jgi:hypothetical protein